ncbi:hypothetical protein [Rummeliibacillus pycnus]|uniref:hypothetical protein n=1 Tax=Rummeliibacillus pycnus TaxID=101070 RepID=UPI000C9B5E9B|nr:hypothetical protein [Rummeliibacillus pycnus]
MKKDQSDTGVEKVIGKGTYPSVTNNAIKSVVADFGGTATSAYSHPVNYNKPPIFSSGGLSIHEAQGQSEVPHSTNHDAEDQMSAE